MRAGKPQVVLRRAPLERGVNGRCVMLKRLTLAAAMVVGLFAPAALAGSSDAKYELRRQGMGPRPDRYVLVRVDRDGGDRPYALTGDTDRPAKKRVVQRWAGPHYIGPVTVYEK